MRLRCSDVLPDGWHCSVFALASGRQLQVDQHGGVQRVFTVARDGACAGALCVAHEMGDNPKYVPRGLSKSDAAKQRRSIERGEDRPKVDYPYRRSKWVRMYEEQHGQPITNLSYIDRNLLTRAGARRVLDKGRAPARVSRFLSM